MYSPLFGRLSSDILARSRNIARLAFWLGGQTRPFVGGKILMGRGFRDFLRVIPR